MGTHSVFSSDTRRALAQWAGVFLASILSGILLGILRQRGTPLKTALEWAIPVGLSLALITWVWVIRAMPQTKEISGPIGVASMTFDGEFITTGYGLLGQSYELPPQTTFACQIEEQGHQEAVSSRRRMQEISESAQVYYGRRFMETFLLAAGPIFHDNIAIDPEVEAVVVEAALKAGTTLRVRRIRGF